MIVLLSTLTLADTGGPDGPLPLVTADAGDDFMAYPGQVIELNGSGSGDGDLTYAWVRTAGPPAELDDSTLPNPRFTANDAGTYTFELTVSAGEEASLPDAISVVIVHTDAGTLHDTGCAVGGLGGMGAAWLLGLVAVARRREVRGS